MPRIYFDWAASAPCDPEAAETLSAALKRYAANPSSRHTSGKEARACLETCRNECADLLKTTPETVVFTSGGSESNNIVLTSFLTKRRQIHILSAPFEHPSVINPLFELKSSGHKVEFLKTTSEGVIDTDDLRRKLTPETALVCLMHTHNETGAVQPLSEAVQAVREFESGGKRIHFHCDAVQAGGKTAIDLTAADVDSASFSAHKFGGARGAGILFLKKPLQPLYLGGGQENGMRSGTENVFGIKMFELAAIKHYGMLRENFYNAKELSYKLWSLLDKQLFVRISPENGSPYILTVGAKGVRGETILHEADDCGLIIGTGSACSSNDKKRYSRVILACGVGEDVADGILRLSLGCETCESDVVQAAAILNLVVKNRREMMS